MAAAMRIYQRTVHPALLIRRITLVVNHVVREADLQEENGYEQLNLFTDYAALQSERKTEEEKRGKERQLQEAMLSIRNRYGKDAVLKGLNLQEGATGRERSRQIGGHKA